MKIQDKEMIINMAAIQRKNTIAQISSLCMTLISIYIVMLRLDKKVAIQHLTEDLDGIITAVSSVEDGIAGVQDDSRKT